MRLTAVEVRRLWARRAIVVVLVAAALLSLALVASALWSTRPVTDADVSAAQQRMAVERERVEPRYQECLEDPAETMGRGSTAQMCDDLLPQMKDYLVRPDLDLADENDSTGVAVVLLLAVAGLLVGTTFAGADWHSGSLGNQLLFEPRRGRVWGAKALAVTASVALAAVTVLGVVWATLGGFASTRELPVPSSVWHDIAWQSGRGVLLAAAAALGAYALTMLLRSTVATFGVVFGLLVAAEVVTATVRIDMASQWSPSHNVLTWVQGGTQVYDESRCPGREGDLMPCDPTYTLSMAHGGIYLGVLLLLAAVVSVVAFRRRDVT